MAAQFAIIPDYLLTEASPAALRVYMALALRADHKTGQCWPSRATVARMLNVSPRTVTRSIQSLIELGAIQVEPRFDQAGDQTSNLYTLPFAISRRGGVTPMSRGGVTDVTTGRATDVQGVGSPMSTNPDSSELEPIDPEVANAFPREEGETIGAWLIRIASLRE